MIIVRDGKEFELTQDELRQAFWEQEKLYNIEDIEGNMELYLDEELYKILKDDREFIEYAAYELKVQQGEHDLGFSSALEVAFAKAKAKILLEKYK